jgi:exosome complex RNA-binding protein Rrp4
MKLPRQHEEWYIDFQSRQISVLTLQNFIDKHIEELENVQGKKKNEKD